MSTSHVVRGSNSFDKLNHLFWTRSCVMTFCERGRASEKKIAFMIDTVWPIDFYFYAIICVLVSFNKTLRTKGFWKSCGVIKQ